MAYDSTEESLTHIKRVGDFIKICIRELGRKAELHDYDKVHDPVEKSLFDKYTPKLKDCTYGSEEYKTFLAGLKQALDIHYKNNRHHPEHFENGIRGMNLIDLLEMICDWKAASERHDNGNIFRSIEINQKRFGYTDELKEILRNTVEFLVEKDCEINNKRS